MTETVLILGLAVIAFLAVGALIVRELQRPGAAAAPVPRAGVEHHEDDEVTRVGFDIGKRDIPSVRPEEEPQEPAAGSSSLPRTAFDGDAELGFDEPTGPHMRILTSAAGRTEVGRKRKRNEDSLFVDDRLGLYVVADGMGGYAGGDVASTIAVNAVSTSFDVSGGFVAKTGVVDDARPRGGNELVWSIEQANRAIVERAAEDESYTGMGTTIVAARFSRRRQRVFIAHVGDSRCYRIRGDKMTLLTRDHTLAGKGMTGPLAAHLSRALGASNDVKVDLLVDAPLRGDRYLLCSDGLSKMIDEETIASLALAHANDSVDAVVQALVDKANAAGGRDNITVIFVLIEEPQDPAKADRGAGRSAPDAPRKTDGDGTER